MRKTVDPWTDSTLRAHTAAISLTIFAIGAALLFFIAYAGWSMNRASSSNQLDLIDSALTQKVNQTLMEQKAIAFWDDSTLAAQKLPEDASWFDTEIGAYLTEGYGHQIVFALGPTNDFQYGYSNGKHVDRATFDRYRGVIDPLVKSVRTGKPTGFKQRDRFFGLMQDRYEFLGGAKSARWAGNILAGPEGPVLVSVITIVPTVDVSIQKGPPALLISLIPIDQSLFDLISGSIQIKQIRFSQKGPAPKGAVILTTDEGKQVGHLLWSHRQPGRMLIHYVLPVFALLLIAAAFFTRKIFQRLESTQKRLREQEANARFMAMHDGLSQLPNRRNFTQALREKLEAAAQDPMAPRIAVAYVDVDRFKDVNDAIGHSAGDKLVMQIGPRLLAVLRHDDLLARLGGDEFAIMRELRQNDDPEALGRSIMSAFKRPFEIGNGQIEVTASIGIAVAARGELAPERVVQDADISLYRAKDQGRNQFIIFHATMAEEVQLRHALENDLRSAIGTNQIVMHYQPIISARTGEVTSVEALVRWLHPERGMIAPDRFISLAERSGLMVPLGDHILETVLREAHRFGDMSIAINLSPLQLRQRTLPRRISQLCHRFNVNPSRITLEVTESMMIESSGVCGEVFQKLCEMGFKTALDDFGTGYSSLGYLHRFKFDKIKIDRSFVSSGSLSTMRPIVEAIVHIGRGLRMEIVAEGVESAAEFAMVQALGCTEAQGYGISKPRPLDEIVDFINAPRDAQILSGQSIFLAHG